MFTARRAAMVALPAILIASSLAGCSLLVAKDSDATPTGIAACALGHKWTLDTADIAAQVLKDLQKRGIQASDVKADGTQVMDWQVNGSVSIDTDYTLTVTVPTNTVVATQTHKGTASGKAYINAEVAIPRNWKDKDFAVKTTFLVNGAAPAADAAAPFTIATTDFDDSVGLELTCDGDKLTTHPRGSDVTQTWKKSD